MAEDQEVSGEKRAPQVHTTGASAGLLCTPEVHTSTVIDFSPRGPLPDNVPEEHRKALLSQLRHPWSRVIEIADASDAQARAQRAAGSDYHTIVLPKTEHQPWRKAYTVLPDVFETMIDDYNARNPPHRINKARLSSLFGHLEAVSDRAARDQDGEPITSIDGMLLRIVDTPGSLLAKTTTQIAEIWGTLGTYARRQRAAWIDAGIVVNHGRGWVEFVVGPWRGNQRLMYAYAEQQPAEAVPHVVVDHDAHARAMAQQVEAAFRSAGREARRRAAAENRADAATRRADYFQDIVTMIGPVLQAIASGRQCDPAEQSQARLVLEKFASIASGNCNFIGEGEENNGNSSTARKAD